MILVDTSVWLRALYNREPYRSELDALLDSQVVLGHNLIFGELLIGDRGGRNKLMIVYPTFVHVPTVSHETIVRFVQSRRLHGRGLSWIDVHLLASALAGGHQLWTADGRLAEVAQELGVAWNPLPSKHGVQHR